MGQWIHKVEGWEHHRKQNETKKKEKKKDSFEAAMKQGLVSNYHRMFMHLDLVSDLGWIPLFVSLLASCSYCLSICRLHVQVLGLEQELQYTPSCRGFLLFSTYQVHINYA